jgi:siroheme synthase-like protein
MTDVDWAVAAHAETAGVWVTSADDAAHCTFIHPSVHRDGLVSVAVSTGGASPAMASWLRRRVGEAVGSGLGILAELLEEARRLPDRPKGIRTAEPLRGRVRRAAG